MTGTRGGGSRKAENPDGPQRGQSRIPDPDIAVRKDGDRTRVRPRDGVPRNGSRRATAASSITNESDFRHIREALKPVQSQLNSWRQRCPSLIFSGRMSAKRGGERENPSDLRPVQSAHPYLGASAASRCHRPSGECGKLKPGDGSGVELKTLCRSLTGQNSACT